jgi:cold shock CspA family protein
MPPPAVPAPAVPAPAVPPPGHLSRQHAIAAAVFRAATAAAAGAAAEWEASEKQRAMDARKKADQAADAVDAQRDVLRQAELAVVHARQKLEELERSSAQARHGGPPTEGGTVARWNDDKGYGFICPRAGGVDLFVHNSAILDGTRLQEGTPVRFVRILDEPKQRYRAEAVTGSVAATGEAVGGTAASGVAEGRNDAVAADKGTKRGRT